MTYLAESVGGERDLVLPDRAATVRYVQAKYRGFGLLDPATWEGIAESSFAYHPSKRGFVATYDPAITALLGKPGRVKSYLLARAMTSMAWADWEAVRAPVLVLRGGSSPVLDPETIRAMVRSKDDGQVEVATFEGTPDHPIGHAPFLSSSDQVQVVRAWIRRHSP